MRLRRGYLGPARTPKSTCAAPLNGSSGRTEGPGAAQGCHLTASHSQSPPPSKRLWYWMPECCGAGGRLGPPSLAGEGACHPVTARERPVLEDPLKAGRNKGVTVGPGARGLWPDRATKSPAWRAGAGAASRQLPRTEITASGPSLPSLGPPASPSVALDAPSTPQCGPGGPWLRRFLRSWS